MLGQNYAFDESLGLGSIVEHSANASVAYARKRENRVAWTLHDLQHSVLEEYDAPQFHRRLEGIELKPVTLVTCMLSSEGTERLNSQIEDLKRRAQLIAKDVRFYCGKDSKSMSRADEICSAIISAGMGGRTRIRLPSA